jgi:hypothetical protein
MLAFSVALLSSFRPGPFAISAAATAIVGFVVLAGTYTARTYEANQLARSAPAIPQDLRRPGSWPSAETITFRVLPERSSVSYFIDLDVGSLPLPRTVKGRPLPTRVTGTTNRIEGEFHIAYDGPSLYTGAESWFAVNLGDLTSGLTGPIYNVQQALESGEHPQARFALHSITGYDANIPFGQEQHLRLEGTLELHGVQLPAVWNALVRVADGVISAVATTTFEYQDFNIEKPRVAWLVSTEPKLTLQVQLMAQVV